MIIGKVKSESEVVSLSNPMDCSPPGSSVYGIFQAEVLHYLIPNSDFSRRKINRKHCKSSSLSLRFPSGPAHRTLVFLVGIYFSNKGG